MSVAELARPEIRALLGYSSARMEADSAAVMLNANESPWPPASNADSTLNRYPEPQPARLRARLARLYGVRDEQVLLGRGSDEAIDLLLRVFCRPGRDAVLVCPPTFGMYRVAAEVQGVQVVESPLRDGRDFDLPALQDACGDCVRLLFLCSPNNPTGGVLPLQQIGHLAQALRGRAMLVVDEAYIEFAAAESAASLLDAHHNLAVLRTLSKAWALAGARVGALLAHPEAVDLCRRVMAPYPLPAPCVEAALAELAHAAAMRRRVAIVAAERTRMAAALAARPRVREVLPSQANFLCVRFDAAAATCRGLATQGIVVRDVSAQPGLGGCLRISIGTAAENDRVLDALARLVVAA